MTNIQIITNEWIDIVLLDNENKVAKRKTNNDIGIYSINENILEIEWNIWGKEIFLKTNNIFYNCKDNNFEIIGNIFENPELLFFNE